MRKLLERENGQSLRVNGCGRPSYACFGPWLAPGADRNRRPTGTAWEGFKTLSRNTCADDSRGVAGGGDCEDGAQQRVEGAWPKEGERMMAIVLNGRDADFFCD